MRSESNVFHRGIDADSGKSKDAYGAGEEGQCRRRVTRGEADLAEQASSESSCCSPSTRSPSFCERVCAGSAGVVGERWRGPDELGRRPVAMEQAGVDAIDGVEQVGRAMGQGGL